MPSDPNFGRLDCGLAKECSGCALIEVPYAEQKGLKIETLENAWSAANVPVALPRIDWVAVASGGLRDRADLMVESSACGSRRGLFSKKIEGNSHIIDIESCPQYSPALAEWLTEFRKVAVDVARGSIRLRVAPNGDRGVWLDLANLDVKRLLDEGSSLRQLRQMAFVEIGQRRKKLIEVDGRLKLGDPELRPWFETYLPQQTKTEVLDYERAPVFTTIGSFTQPGFLANRALVKTLIEMIHPLKAQKAVEFGSGSGNLTLPLATLLPQGVTAYETDGLALEGLKRSAEACGLTDRIQIRGGDYQRLNSQRRPDFNGIDLIVVDPPRSGLQQFLDPLLETPPMERPRSFVYVSCFADSFATDSRRLVEGGYRPHHLSIVDQFPQSPHFESVALFTRDA